MAIENVETYLYEVIKADATLAAKFTTFASQVGVGEIDENKIMPQLFIQQIDDPIRWDNPDRWQRWRIYIRDNDYVNCKVIRELLYGVLNRGYGTLDGFNMSGINFIDKGQDPYRNGSGYWETYADIRVTYNVEE